jgi:hypothetical protein
MDWSAIWTWLRSPDGSAIGTWIGAAASVVAVFVACWAVRVAVRIAKHIHNLDQSAQERRDEEGRQRREQQLRTALEHAIQVNLEWLNDPSLRDEKNIRLDSPDLTILDATAAVKYEVIDDREFCLRIDEIRSELRDIAVVCDRLIHLSMNYHQRAKGYFDSDDGDAKKNDGDAKKNDGDAKKNDGDAKKKKSMYEYFRPQLTAERTKHVEKVLPLCEAILKKSPK